MAPPDLGIKPMKVGFFVSFAIDFVLTGLKSVAPLSMALLAFRIFLVATKQRKSLLFSFRTSLFRKALMCWIFSEVVFFGYCKLLLHTTLQNHPDKDKITQISDEERKILFQRCLATTDSPEAFAESWFVSHTPFRELRLGNIREWLAWGLFHKHDLEKEMTSPEEREQLDEFIHEFQTRAKTEIPPGYNTEAQLMKFSGEPVTHTHRPLFLYVLIHHLLQEVIAPVWLGMHFQLHRKRSQNITYYFKRGVKHEELPALVFVHGLGVGYLPYVGFVRDMMAQVENSQNAFLFGRSVLLLELHAASQRIAPPDLLRDDFVSAVQSIFHQENITRPAMFLGHSYGSFALTWICKRAPELVSSLALLDPACLFLHYPNVLFSILYKQPYNAFERAAHFVIREELFWNYHARRHFFWYANVLFLEDVTVPVLVVLSEDDIVVPVKPGKVYVEEYCETKKTEHAVKLVYLNGCEHGGWLWNQNFRNSVTEGVQWLAGEEVTATTTQKDRN